MPGLVEAIVMTILAIVFPPLPVLLETGCRCALEHRLNDAAVGLPSGVAALASASALG